MTALHWLTATQIAAAYQKRSLSPITLVQALLDRIAQFDTTLLAFNHVDAEGALQTARAVQAEIADGRHRGGLHGVPVAVKDIIDVAGMPTSCHSAMRQGHMPAADAVVIARLRAAGAIILGKLSTHEFAIGGPSFDLPSLPARNPWNPERHPGGSSSGSGAALAAGFVPLALGTDTGGSIRHPASACGVVGLKPSYGLVPRDGVQPLSWSLDHVGPMARTAADAALLLEVMADRPPSAPLASLPPEQMLHGLRIGMPRAFHTVDWEAAPEVQAALETAASLLRAQGATVIDVTLPTLREFATVNRVILASEGWVVHGADLRATPERYGRLSRRRLTTGAFFTAEDLIQAQRRRVELAASVDAVFTDVDLLLCASSMDPACAIEDEAEVARTYPRQARVPFNLTGHPALAMMSGLSSDGLPLSLQFVGPMGHDAQVLALAAAYQRATAWQDMHPPWLA